MGEVPGLERFQIRVRSCCLPLAQQGWECGEDEGPAKLITHMGTVLTGGRSLVTNPA